MSPEDQTWTLRRVLAAMSDNERTGVLEVTTGSSVTRIHLRKGGIVLAERKSAERYYPVADYLVESGRISTDTLIEARQKSASLEIPLDEYLVSKKLASEDLVKRFADLHVADLLFPLFSRPNLNIEFKEERPLTTNFVTHLPISYVLKEADRRSEAWPELRRRVGSSKAVYTKDPAVLAELLGYTAPTGNDEPLPELSGSARVVFFHVNGVKTVEQIGRATGLGMYEAYRGLCELLDAFLLELVSHDGVGEQPPISSQLSAVMTYVTYALIAMLLGLGGHWVLTNPEVMALDRTAGSEEITQQIRNARVDNVRQSLEVYQLLKGVYPETLSELAEAEVVAPATINAMMGMDYRRSGASYRLTDGPVTPKGESEAPGKSAASPGSSEVGVSEKATTKAP